MTRSGQVYQNKNSSELFCSALKYLKGHKIRNENITCLGKAALWIISLHSRSSSGKIFQLYQGIIGTFFTSPWAPRIILSEQCSVESITRSTAEWVQWLQCRGQLTVTRHLNNSFRIKFLGNVQFSTHATGAPYVYYFTLNDYDNDPFLHPLKYPLKYTLMVMWYFCPFHACVCTNVNCHKKCLPLKRITCDTLRICMNKEQEYKKQLSVFLKFPLITDSGEWHRGYR